MLLTTAALIGSGLAAAGGAIGGAVNKSKAKKTMNAWYDYAEDYAKTQANSSIFDSPYGKSLLKLQDRSDRKALDAVNNQLAAGGGTMENALAARQSINENRDRVTSQLLQYDDRNRRAWQEKGLDIAGQRANYAASNYMQAAQDWNQWGGQMAGSLLSLGSTGLISGAGAVAGAASAASAGVNPAAIEPAPDYVYGPLAPAVDTGSMGGLRKA